jgi:hypothetical protein
MAAPFDKLTVKPEKFRQPHCMRTVKNITFFLILISLAISVLQSRYHLFREEPLKGFYKQSSPPELKFFTWQRWFSSVFQDEFATRLNDNIGLRKSLVRIGNQYDYSLFGLTHVAGWIKGKEDYLYEEDYIHEYNGDYFIGTEAIDRKLARLKNVMDSLKAHGIPLILVFEPGKASFYPEYIPRRFHPGRKSQNNYGHYIAQSQKLGIPFLDLNRYFLLMKDTATYPLFPRYGMHWSMYGVHLAADTMSKYMAKATGKPMPVFKARRMHQSVNSLYTDYDIGELFNLACPLPPALAAYPVVPFSSMPDGTLSSLVIADSYYITLVETYGKKWFGKQDFWYYNKKVYPNQNVDPPELVDKTDLRSKLLKYDIILLMTSEINLHCGFWSFADEAYLAFHPGVKDPAVYTIENNIRNERTWFQFVANRASLEKMPLEKMIRTNAEFTFFSYYNDIPDKCYWDSIQYLVMNIRNNPGWLAQITKNAQKENMPVDTALKLNAIYSYDQSKKNH